MDDKILLSLPECHLYHQLLEPSIVLGLLTAVLEQFGRAPISSKACNMKYTVSMLRRHKERQPEAAE